MKRMFGAMMIAGLLAAPLAVRAHEDARQGGEHGEHGRFAKMLDLTPAQKAQLKALHEETANTMKPLKEKAEESVRHLKGLLFLHKKGDDSDADAIAAALSEARKDRAAVREAMKSAKAKMDAVLTPLQQAKAFVMMGERMHHPGWQGRGGPRAWKGRSGRADGEDAMPPKKDAEPSASPVLPPAGDDGSDD